MREITCVCESVYGDALTRGQRYEVRAKDSQKRQVRITGDNGRTRWFPTYCFDLSNGSVPILASFELDDPINPHDDLPIDVTVELSNGEQRWCIFATPSALARCGNWIEGTQVPFHYGNRHIIIARELSKELIGRMLRYIDSQGELAECTLPFAPASPGSGDHDPE